MAAILSLNRGDYNFNNKGGALSNLKYEGNRASADSFEVVQAVDGSVCSHTTTDDVKMGRPHCLVNKHWLHNKNRHKDAHRTLLEFGFAKTIYHESNSKLGAIFKAKAARSRAKCTRNASKSELQNFQAQFKNPLRNQTLMTFTKV